MGANISSPYKQGSGNDFEKREYCGVFGIYSFSGAPVAHDIYFGLMNLQHRGQDSAGAATCENGKISSIRHPMPIKTP